MTKLMIGRIFKALGLTVLLAACAFFAVEARGWFIGSVLAALAIIIYIALLKLTFRD